MDDGGWVTLASNRSRVHMLYVTKHSNGYNALLYDAQKVFPRRPPWEPPPSAVILAQLANNLFSAKLNAARVPNEELWQGLVTDFEDKYAPLFAQSTTDWMTHTPVTVVPPPVPTKATTVPTALPTEATRVKVRKKRRITGQRATTTAIFAAVDGDSMKVYNRRDASAALKAEATRTGKQIIVAPPRA